MDENARTLPGGGYVETSEVASLLDTRAQVSAWTLWQRKAGHEDTSDEAGHVPSLARYCHQGVVQWARRFAVLRDARRPTRPLRHPEIPLRGAPDLVLDDVPAYGPGPGFALVKWVPEREWVRRWCRPQPQVHPPGEVMVEAQALLLVSGAKWGIVVPVIGDGTMRGPLRVSPDRELMGGIARAVSSFARSLDPSDPRPPAPDATGPGAVQALRALAKSSPRSPAEPRELGPAEVERYAPLVEELSQGAAELERLAEERRAVRSRTEEARRTLVELVQGRGGVRIGPHVVALREHRPAARAPDESWVEVHIEAPVP